MKMTLNQTKLVGLTMNLDLKAREYKELCKKFDELKQKNLDPNAPEFETLKQEFIKNLNEIKQINAQLKALKQDDDK